VKKRVFENVERLRIFRPKREEVIKGKEKTTLLNVVLPNIIRMII
jgi:hypothetical protein